ncbi:hypothetical protein CRG98_011438 [Punica granatum]|uniref:Zinc knuckle CX2CX4HX4C domain-containing protein n=1 Tax=Punica granatum TaxID=22663 RepID=A0A2I0KI58_PUNGR|nr:hypothetical protein CRG98_011438 [Punica granatum]
MLVERAGKVLEIDWKDFPSLPKWFVTPRALVKVLVSKPLCPGRLISRKRRNPTWVYFKYEHLKTFCYDCGTLEHDQAHCQSDSPVTPNLYGPWLIFDNQSDLTPPQVSATPTETPTTASDTYSPDGSDNSPHVNAAKGMYYRRLPDFSIVEDPEKAADTTDFLLYRGHVTPYTSRKEMGWERPTQFINTDSIFSGLVDLQDNIQAQFSSSDSPNKSLNTGPVKTQAYHSTSAQRSA